MGYDRWLEIIGDRLLPGFPGAGGDMKDGILYTQFGSEKHQGTIFGEIIKMKDTHISVFHFILSTYCITY
jgi:hypothetical protein